MEHLRRLQEHIYPALNKNNIGSPAQPAESCQAIEIEKYENSVTRISTINRRPRYGGCGTKMKMRDMMNYGFSQML